MNRLSDNDKNWGPLTIGTWHKSFTIQLRGGNEDDCVVKSSLLIGGFGYAIRLTLPQILAPSVQYGFSLSDMGNGYDFFQLFYGPQTYDSSTTKSWSKSFPWKQWRHQRTSFYKPDGTHFFTKGKNFTEFMEAKEQCPKTRYEFEDYDGQKIVASCTTEEREWHKGSGWFKWLRHFYKPFIRRSLDISFSSEVGPGKGSWKGGTIGHGIDMLKGESQEEAFRRYCDIPTRYRNKEYKLKFIRKVD